MAHERQIFTQITDFLPRFRFYRCVKRYKGNKNAKGFTCWEQLLCMFFGQLTKRESLRDIINCLNSQKDKLYRLGFRTPVARSTLAYANEHRNWEIYRDFALILIDEARKLYIDNKDFTLDLNLVTYALDATIINLCLSVFKWAKFKTTKAGIKLHTLLDLKGNIPIFIHITEAKIPDVKILDILEFEKDALYVMDRGYLSFERLYKIHSAEAYFVIRAKKGLSFRRLYSHKVDKSKGLRCDQTIVLKSPRSARNYPEKLRRVKFYDEEENRIYVVLTNNFELSAEVVMDLYRYRWQIEQFFKWMKQHLKIKVFWGRSDNAVMIQVWTAVCVYVVVAIIKKKLKLDEDLYKILQILQVVQFDKSPVIELFSSNQPQQKNTDVQQRLL